ncbi:MAG: RDD family protein [Thaumarchaeota archaeon]|nr:RDD family protein [Nitrososphaerota archaeon]
MAFCATCGKELPIGVAFCPNCGAPVPGTQGAASTTSSPTATGFDALTKDRQAQDYWVSRLVAFIVDAIIVGIAVFVLITLAFVSFFVSGGFAPFSLLIGGTFSLFGGLIFVLYFTFFEATSGASIGKRFLNLKVVSKAGSNPNFPEAFVRNISKIHWVLLLLDIVVGLALSKGYQQKYSDQLMGTTVTRK